MRARGAGQAIFGFSPLCVSHSRGAYESWALPFSVLLGTPIAVFGAFGALWALGLENDVFTQIGLVMLIGLAAKNAILIVEFAKMEYEKGKSIADASLAAARLRLRPILMTAFAFILESSACSPQAGPEHRQNLSVSPSSAACWRRASSRFSLSGLLYAWRARHREEQSGGPNARDSQARRDGEGHLPAFPKSVRPCTFEGGH